MHGELVVSLVEVECRHELVLTQCHNTEGTLVLEHLLKLATLNLVLEDLVLTDQITHQLVLQQVEVV